MTATAFLFTSASYGQAGQAPAPDGPVPGNRQKAPAPVMPESLSCAKGAIEDCW